MPLVQRVGRSWQNCFIPVSQHPSHQPGRRSTGRERKRINSLAATRERPSRRVQAGGLAAVRDWPHYQA